MTSETTAKNRSKKIEPILLSVLITGTAEDGEERWARSVASADTALEGLEPVSEVCRVSASTMAAARNQALKKARGAYVTFIDAGDEVMPEMYYMMLSHACAGRVAGAANGEGQAGSEDGGTPSAGAGGPDLLVCDAMMAPENAPEYVWDTAAVTVECTDRLHRDAGEREQVLWSELLAMPGNKVVRRGLLQELKLHFPAKAVCSELAVMPAVVLKADVIEVMHMPFCRRRVRGDRVMDRVYLRSLPDGGAEVLPGGKADLRPLVREAPALLRQTAAAGSDGLLCAAQLVPIALLQIRKENARVRSRDLQAFLRQSERIFPGLWDMPEVRAENYSASPAVQKTLHVSLGLLKAHRIAALIAFWQALNAAQGVTERVLK